MGIRPGTGTIVELSLPLEALPLGRSLASTRGFRLDFDRVVPLGARPCPFVWLLDRSLETPREDRLATFERSAEDEAAVEGLERIAEVDDAILYRVTWADRSPSLRSGSRLGSDSSSVSGTSASTSSKSSSKLEGKGEQESNSSPAPTPELGPESAFVLGVVRTGGAILEAAAGTTGWTVRVRFDDPERVAAFQRYCCDHDVAIELERVAELEDGPSVVPAELTDPQADALLTAARMGYFARPRDATLEELADALDISPQAAGGRIRRGVANLVSEAFPLEDVDPDGDARA